MTHILRTRGLIKIFTAGFRVSRDIYGRSLGTRSKRLPPAAFLSTTVKHVEPVEPVERDLPEGQTSCASQTRDAESLNQALVDAVQQENFTSAENIRLRLVSEFGTIDPNPAYERAALAQIRWDNQQDLHAFLTWLQLVPDNEDPSRVENGPLTKTRNILFRRGTPARNLLLITEFSLVCAAKGYGQLVWDDLVLLMGRFQLAQQAVEFFLSFEAKLLEYYSKYHPGLVEETASRQRYLLIMLCCDAGWLGKAVQIVQDSTRYRTISACERLLELLQARDDKTNVALVKQCLLRQRAMAAPLLPDPPKKSSIASRISDFVGAGSEFRKVTQYYSTRSIIDGHMEPRSRTWVAKKLREVKSLIARRALVAHASPGNSLHQIFAHYEACKGYPRGLSTLQKKALARSDPCSYIWLCKEMFYLHQCRKYADIVALFLKNFFVTFLPPEPWHILRRMASPSEPLRSVHKVPKLMKISRADAWVIWNALIRLSVLAPEPLPVLEELHHSLVHFSSQLTDRQFQAFPTAYSAAFRSIIWAYGELAEIDKAAAAAGDLALIGKLEPTNVVVFDELAGVYARAGNVPAATRVLKLLEELGPRPATYGVLMDAYLHAGLVDEASRIEARLKMKCKHTVGANWRIDATLTALRAAEKARDLELAKTPSKPG
ncbi:hypothetical protein B0H13DRAFT_1971093 [Mycena leptocephala]|nr:hypothetical protein B0H13DRAFT_1971093 [Mycena leptocephala]